MADNHIIVAAYDGGGYTKTRPAYQYDYGQVLRLEDFGDLLPDSFEMHFSIGNGQAITRIGTDGQVDIPNVCLERYGTVTAWLFLHDTANDGETKYVIETPVRSRGKTTDQEPTPQEQSVITQAIAALNSGVDAAQEAQQGAEEARTGAENAADSIMNASAEAESLDAGVPATASVTNDDGVITFHIGIPKGDTGDAPIDDTAGMGAGSVVWSADKSYKVAEDKADKTNTVLNTTLSRGRRANSSAGVGSVAFGNNAAAIGPYSQAFGNGTFASGYFANATGFQSAASGAASTAEGNMTIANGEFGHSEGDATEASGYAAHAENEQTIASGYASHAENEQTSATGDVSHAQGSGTTASGFASDASGLNTVASGSQAVASGEGTIAQGNNQRVSGRYNIVDTDQGGQYAVIVGNGTGSNARSNAAALDWNGNARIAGDVYVGCGADSTGGNKLAKESQIPDVSGKLDKPTVAGANGQVLTSNGRGGQTWQTPATVPQIDDTAGIGDSTKTWSANKLATDQQSLFSAINVLEERTEYPKLLNGWDTVDFEYGFITDSGNVTPSSTFRSTTFIPVQEGNTIAYKLKGYINIVYAITAYDSSKTRIANKSVNGGSSFSEGTYTVASGTAYVKLCSDNYNNAYFTSEDIYGTEITPIKEFIAEELPKKLNIQQDASDSGKLLGIGEDGTIEAKTVQTEIADNSITYEKLQKSVVQIQQSIVDFWYYNGEKQTDGKSIEVIIPLNTVVYFEYPSGTNTYRVYYASDDGTVLSYSDINTSYFRIDHDSNNRKFTFAAIKDGKFYIPVSFGTTQYFPANTTINAVETPYPINFLKSGWQPDIMGITVKYPREVYPLKSYNHNGSIQAFGYKIKTYYIPFVGWYKTKAYFNLLDSDWDFIRTKVGSYFYNDGSISYVQGRNNTDDVSPEYVGEGISAFNGMQVISKGDSLNINKPIGRAVVCFGDSITSTGYPSKLQEIAKCIALNYGRSGNSSGKIRKVVTGIGEETGTPFDWAANPVDTAIILAGYNDTYQGTIEGDIPATNIADASNDWTAYLALFNASHPVQGTTCGNVGFMIEWIQANHPNVRIVLCNYHNNTDAKPTRYSDVDTAVQALCEYYGVKYIDIRRTCGINKKNASTYLTDGLHPNDAGQELIAKAIFRAM